jgi:phosphopantothenoylcysteine decarboxylase/phosphopantothenate--cysteine ligase
MGGADNRVILVTAEGEERWERAGKDAVARRLADRIAAALTD